MGAMTEAYAVVFHYENGALRLVVDAKTESEAIKKATDWEPDYRGNLRGDPLRTEVAIADIVGELLHAASQQAARAGAGREAEGRGSGVLRLAEVAAAST